MNLSFTDREKIRGMLADKQSAKTIAEQFEVNEKDVLALAKPKAVRCAACVGGLPACLVPAHLVAARRSRGRRRATQARLRR